jgi:MFS family permease
MMHNQPKTIWNRYFVVALIGYFFLFMTVSLFFIFPIFLKQFDASESRIGLIMGINSLVIIFIRPIFGRLIDVQGRKKISIIGIIILIIVFPFFLFVKNAGWLPLILRTITGVGWGMSMTATMTLCSDLAPAERLAHSMGIIGIGGLTSQALGPFIGEEIVSYFGFKALFITCLIFVLGSFLCIYFTPETIGNNKIRNPEKIREIIKIQIPLLIIICALPLVHGAVRGSVVYFISLFIKDIGLQRVGPFFIAFSLSAVVTRLGIGDISDRYGRKKIIFPAVLIISFNLFLITKIQSIFMVIMTGLIGGFGQGLLFPALSTYMIDILGHENKGLAISLYLTLFDMGIGLGSPVFGWVSQSYGYKTMYLLAGLILFLVATAFTFKAPNPLKVNRNLNQAN